MTKRRILIVDDEVPLTRALQYNLEDVEGYEIRTANSGTAGLAAAREFKPDVILLDLMMPDMDGTEVAAQIDDDPILKGTPVVFLTAVVQRAEAKVAEGVIGGRVFLPKPVKVQEVIDCIEKYARPGAPT